MKDQSKGLESLAGGLSVRSGAVDQAHGVGKLRYECRDKDGNLKWVEEIENLLTNEQKNYVTGVALRGVAQITTWYLGLKGAGAAAATDTMAAHAGWAELTAYSEAARPTFGGTGVSSGATNNNAAPARFTANANMTVAGSFLTSVATKGGTTGTLWGVGDFGTSRAMVSGDTLDVSYSYTQS